MSATIVGALLGLIWGAVWAAALQWTSWGRWMAGQRTWLTVVIGVAGSLAACAVAVPVDDLLTIVVIISASAICIIGRSLYNEYQEERGA